MNHIPNFGYHGYVPSVPVKDSNSAWGLVLLGFAALVGFFLFLNWKNKSKAQKQRIGETGNSFGELKPNVQRNMDPSSDLDSLWEHLDKFN